MDYPRCARALEQMHSECPNLEESTTLLVPHPAFLCTFSSYPTKCCLVLTCFCLEHQFSESSHFIFDICAILLRAHFVGHFANPIRKQSFHQITSIVMAVHTATPGTACIFIDRPRPHLEKCSVLQTVDLQRAAQPLFLCHGCYFELAAPCSEHQNPCFQNLLGSVHLPLLEFCALHFAVGSILEKSVVHVVQRMLDRIISTVWVMHIHGRTMLAEAVFSCNDECTFRDLGSESAAPPGLVCLHHREAVRIAARLRGSGPFAGDDSSKVEVGFAPVLRAHSIPCVALCLIVFCPCAGARRCIV